MSSLPSSPSLDLADETLCVLHPHVSQTGFSSLTVPVQRASTIVFPDAKAYAERNSKGSDAYSYGLHGTPTVRILEAQIAQLEGGAKALLTPSGLSAITLCLLTLLDPGERVLVPDTVYPPVRDFCDRHLSRMGIDIVYYDPLVGPEIAALLHARTRLVLVESPGSTTMEIQDLPAIIAAAHGAGALVVCDNTWATPLLLKPLIMGADISIEALTKYVSGHSDLLMGSIALRDPALFDRLKDGFKLFGFGVSPDDCSLVLRGIETLPVRLAHAAKHALELAQMLNGQPGIANVLHPALPNFPGHALWKRDFAGASGVFSVIVAPDSLHRVSRALDALRLFSIGASWGGTHSLVAPMDIKHCRSVTAPLSAGPILRFSVGMEYLEDLRSDLLRFCQVLAGAD